MMPRRVRNSDTATYAHDNDTETRTYDNSAAMHVHDSSTAVCVHTSGGAARAHDSAARVSRVIKLTLGVRACYSARRRPSRSGQLEKRKQGRGGKQSGGLRETQGRWGTQQCRVC